MYLKTIVDDSLRTLWWNCDEIINMTNTDCEGRYKISCDTLHTILLAIILLSIIVTICFYCIKQMPE